MKRPIMEYECLILTEMPLESRRQLDLRWDCSNKTLCHQSCLSLNCLNMYSLCWSQAINETALTWATFFGTTAAFPTLLLALLKRYKSKWVAFHFTSWTVKVWSLIMWTLLSMFQGKACPEEPNDNRSCSAHQFCHYFWLDDSCILQSFSTGWQGNTH